MSLLKRIMYVEDEQDIQAVARIALETVGGFTLSVCSSGQEALDNVIAFKPDLLLMDVMMPGMDGPTTLKAIKKLPEMTKTPVIFMTAKVQTDEVASLLAMGAMEVIPKPFDPMQLANQIRTVFKQHNGD